MAVSPGSTIQPFQPYVTLLTLYGKVVTIRTTCELRAEAGSNTSTISLRVVAGDEMRTQCLGATLFLGDINTGTWPSRLNKSRT
jgi:hypothetical protein